MPKPKPKTTTTNVHAKRAIRESMRFGFAQSGSLPATLATLLSGLRTMPRARLYEVGDLVGEAMKPADVRAVHNVIITLRRALRTAAARHAAGAR